MKKDAFSTFHPFVGLIYFCIVIGCSMFVMHPVFLCCSIFGGGGYYLYLQRRKGIHFILTFLIPMFLIAAIVNPMFTHQGVTILWYFKNGNPLTLESILFGFGAGAMLVSVLLWFSCYQFVMTSDKFIYLFGKTIPALSLVLTMVLRFVPRFKTQIEKISDAQKCIGKDVSNGNLFQRAGHGMRILSVMTTWALENSVESADSMKARGYGLRGRTTFSIFRFDTRDKVITALMTGSATVIFFGILTEKVSFLYYPLISMNSFNLVAIAVYLCYGGLCILPLMINLYEDIKWHYLKSKI